VRQKRKQRSTIPFGLSGFGDLHADQVSATIELIRGGGMTEAMCDGEVLVAIRERELIRVLEDQYSERVT
jgi:hypothetical protein